MKKGITIIFFYLSFFSIVYGASFRNCLKPDPPLHNYESFFSKADTTYKIVRVTENTYGYEILLDGKILIRQLTIPGQPGNSGFNSKHDAEKVAKLVLQKICKGIMPPTISIQELKHMKIIF